jgi:hypothetical protein
MMDTIEAAFESHAALRPVQIEQLDLFGLPTSARRPFLTECLVFHGVPAHPDAEPQAPAAEDIELGDLLGDQRGLPLREDQYAAR